MIYAHQHYDNPIIDAMDYFWPSKVAKFVIKDKFSYFYSMEMEKKLELDTSETPCNVDMEYSFPQEGYDKLDFNFGLTDCVF